MESKNLPTSEEIIRLGKIPCLHCNYKAPGKSSLKRHQSDIHEKKKHVCEHCNAQLSSRANILRHYQIFHGLVRFKCNQCEYHGEDKIFLRVHREQNHVVIPKIFQCVLCEHQSK